MNDSIPDQESHMWVSKVTSPTKSANPVNEVEVDNVTVDDGVSMGLQKLITNMVLTRLDAMTITMARSGQKLTGTPLTADKVERLATSLLQCLTNQGQVCCSTVSSGSICRPGP